MKDFFSGTSSRVESVKSYSPHLLAAARRIPHGPALPQSRKGNLHLQRTRVASYAGIGRFVMGLLDEVEIVSPEEFREYVRGKLRKV